MEKIDILSTPRDLGTTERAKMRQDFAPTREAAWQEQTAAQAAEKAAFAQKLAPKPLKTEIGTGMPSGREKIENARAYEQDVLDLNAARTAGDEKAIAEIRLRMRRRFNPDAQ